MGHILDLVPNHMGIATSSNVWWADVLENGPSSLYASCFDIDWTPVKVCAALLIAKVTVPAGKVTVLELVPKLSVWATLPMSKVRVRGAVRFVPEVAAMLTSKAALVSRKAKLVSPV